METRQERRGVILQSAAFKSTDVFTDNVSQCAESRLILACEELRVLRIPCLLLHIITCHYQNTSLVKCLGVWKCVTALLVFRCPCSNVICAAVNAFITNVQ